MIFSDLDDTLLDHDSYEWEKAKPALEYCITNNIPVILVSSKTRAEIEVIQRDMGLDFPFVTENGGGIFFPESYEPFLSGVKCTRSGNLIKLILGKPYEDLVFQLGEIAQETGLRLRGFSRMTQKEVMNLTGLTDDKCILALKREFDEPFIVMGAEEVDTELLHSSAEKRGLRISEGGRFFHLHGKSDKGNAIARLISLYEKQYGSAFTMAMGDSPNDFGMFKIVDQPVLVKSKKSFPGIKEKYPGIIITDKYGPEGWNATVMGLLKTKREV